MKILSNGIEISEADRIVLENDLLDIEKWVKDALAGKINNCKKRFLQEWHEKIKQDPYVTSIPVKEDDFIKLVAQKQYYKNRKQREAQK